MIYLQVDNLAKSFNEKTLFEEISFGVHKGQKIALIAKNGTGKSTLLKIISGQETPTAGTIVMRSDLTHAYLDQNPILEEHLNVIEAVFASAKGITNIIKNYQSALLSGDHDKISMASDLMDKNNAWNYEEGIIQILSQLEINQLDKKIGELSGGQKKRVALAAVLISEPDFLILDEPTNHLDLDMIVWLEKYLERSNCTLLMVTHDRYFLDRVCNDILEIDGGKLHRYKGNYSYFLEKRSERIENENAVVLKAKNLLRKELAWIRKTPSARTTKSKSRIENFYDIKETASSKRIEKNIRLDLKGTRLGKKIMEINYLSKKFDDLTLLDNFTYTFKSNEKVGIVGKNGSGKTTLLNILTGLIAPDLGYIETGETVVLSYYKQDGISFDENQRVIDIAKDIAEVVKMNDGSKVSAGEFLTQFLFTPEMQYTQVAKLSGGEKRRLYLMTVLMKNPNFLILDEPTNDLDILTLNVLEEYLNNFKGCVLMVSHDRFFMDKIVEHLFVFEGNAVIRDFPGNYSQYIDYKTIKESQIKKSNPKNQKTEREKPNRDKPNKLSYKEQKEYEELELEIEQLETEKSMIENALYESSSNHEEVMAYSDRLGEIIHLIETKTDRWLELSLKIE
ncbi:MAG: ABC-F family ATP-binding cassette domain-containing protein [Bacteroidales bacterium]|nr:ABC-F family ATP-binding cassette domain-containing protein [Bacteroidales bacterium]